MSRQNSRELEKTTQRLVLTPVRKNQMMKKMKLHSVGSKSVKILVINQFEYVKF